MNVPDPGLEEVGEELLDTDYELGTAADPRIPSMEWEQSEGLYSLKVYSEEFLENDSKAVAGKTLEDVVKGEAEEEDDFYVEVREPSDSLRPDREVYTFSEGEIDEGLRGVVERYTQDYAEA